MQSIKTQRAWHVLLRDIAYSVGLSLLIVSPYFLEHVVSDGYYAFNILDYFLIPHLESLSALTLLLYCVVRLSRKYAISSRWILIPIASLLLIFVFRGFISAAGIPAAEFTSKAQGLLSFIAPNWLDPVTFRRFGVLTLALLSIAFLIKYVRDTKPLFRACITFGWMLGILTIIRVVPMLITENDLADVRQQAIHKITPLNKGDKRIVWVIFDELDYNRTFLNRDKNLALPNIDQLRHESVFAENAVSPAWMTGISLPALITGKYLVDTRPIGPAKLLLQPKTGAAMEWQNTQSIFSRLNGEGKQLDILGYYHPYCNIFPYATPCSSMPAFAYHVWWWGIWQGLRIIPGVVQLTQNNKWIFDAFDRSTQLQLEALQTHLSDKSTTLSFLHLNIPHPPGGRLHGVDMTPDVMALPGYEQNLLTVDWTIGEIVKNLKAQEQSRDIMLIVSSDHWLRTNLHMSNQNSTLTKLEFGNNLAEVHQIPLFIRHFPETDGKVISQPISTIYTEQLIQDFLDNKLTDHASIVAWWQNKAFVAPVAP